MTVHQNTIAALLGPREPEVECDTCFALLDTYVDDVVNGVDALAVHPKLHAHLHGCPVCREEFETLHALVTTTTTGPGGHA